MTSPQGKEIIKKARVKKADRLGKVLMLFSFTG